MITRTVDIVDFFDICNEAHLRVFQEVMNKGCYSKHQLQEYFGKHVNFSEGWYSQISHKIINAYVNDRLK